MGNKIKVSVEHVYSDEEWNVAVDGIEIGVFLPGQGIVLEYTEGSTVSLDQLEAVVQKLRRLETKFTAKAVKYNTLTIGGQTKCQN